MRREENRKIGGGRRKIGGGRRKIGEMGRNKK